MEKHSKIPVNEQVWRDLANIPDTVKSFVLIQRSILIEDIRLAFRILYVIRVFVVDLF